jgi:preprotein translocase subunit SecG
MTTFLYTLHFMVCFVLITVVLLQRGKGSDLGAALGGGGGNTIFGARGAGNFLTKLTTGSAIIFMMTSLSLAYFTTEESDVRLFEEGEVAEEQSPLSEAANENTAAAEGEVTGVLEEVDPGSSGTLEEIPAPADDSGNQP